MRIGQKNKLNYRWARKGSRPRAAHDQRTQSTYLFGAVCPERGAGSGLVLPVCNIASKACRAPTPSLSQAGWVGAIAQNTIQPLADAAATPRTRTQPSRKHLAVHARKLALEPVFKSYDDIVDHCCYAWNTLVDQRWSPAANGQ